MVAVAGIELDALCFPQTHMCRAFSLIIGCYGNTSVQFNKFNKHQPVSKFFTPNLHQGGKRAGTGIMSATVGVCQV
jgi:hypothetical protein